MTIKTNYKKTISMTLTEGDQFAASGNVSMQVRDFNSNKLLGYITGDYFKDHCYIRTTGDSTFYVCPFYAY